MADVNLLLLAVALGIVSMSTFAIWADHERDIEQIRRGGRNG